jgi:hypothetical protein
MLTQAEIIRSFSALGNILSSDNEPLNANINKTYLNNNWLTTENYWQALNYWKSALSDNTLTEFCKDYPINSTPKQVGIIMAGNIPLVGFHDLLVVLLSGNEAIVKPSSDDKYVIAYLIGELQKINSQLGNRITLVERLKDIDAVIATGSNNSFRYFEYYFKDIPSVLRKNRKSIAVLDGSETAQDLDGLARDVFEYFGLGCRNVSYILLPKSSNITKVLDHFMSYTELSNHNKYANNYTYHKALLLMNNEQHLDTGFVLAKERKDLNTPLACIHYSYYENEADLDQIIEKDADHIQCIVGNYSKANTVAFGSSQNPSLQDFADNINTMKFLKELNNSI